MSTWAIRENLDPKLHRAPALAQHGLRPPTPEKIFGLRM